MVAEICERVPSRWEPSLGSIWGLDAKYPPASTSEAHVGTQDGIRTVHRDRCVVDCADTGVNVDFKLLWGPRHMYVPNVSHGATEGSHSDEPAESRA